MAILNLTPDSFSDGGSYPTVRSAVEAARAAVAEGARIIDIGGESTRPGASRVPAEEQLRRVEPVVRAIRGAGGELGAIPISVDTTLSRVAKGAIGAGADAVNDVSAGAEDPEMLPLAASMGAGIVLMHRLRPPGEDSFSDRYERPPAYGDVAAEVRGFLAGRLEVAVEAGVNPECAAIDPGLGFGKTVEQNLELVARTGELLALGRPVVSGASRKSFVGRVSLGGESEPRSRGAGSLAVSLAHFAAGASIFRVHDVGSHVQALRVAEAVRRAGTGHRT